MYFWHIVFCWIYESELPSSVVFWVVNGIGLIGVVVLSEFICLRREMKEISLENFHQQAASVSAAV